MKQTIYPNHKRKLKRKFLWLPKKIGPERKWWKTVGWIEGGYFTTDFFTVRGTKEKWVSMSWVKDDQRLDYYRLTNVLKYCLVCRKGKMKYDHTNLFRGKDRHKHICPTCGAIEWMREINEVNKGVF